MAGLAEKDQTSSLEKGDVHDYVVQQTDQRYHFDAADLDRGVRSQTQNDSINWSRN